MPRTRCRTPICAGTPPTGDRIETPEAWLTKVLTNICLNQLTSARARRETYVGQWLPEPVLAGDRMLGPVDTVEQRESVSLAMLTLMERLSPNERVVYVLREAFGYTHREIAEMLDLTEANCQQLYRRAGQHVAGGRRRTEVDAVAARELVEEFLAAALSGDTEPLVRLLARDAVGVADGGGRIPARKTPVAGALAVARYVRGLFRPTEQRRAYVAGAVAFHAVEANGDPAVLIEVDGRVYGLLCLDASAAGVAALRIQVNPDKLARITRRWAASGPHRPLDAVW
ncbi:sigma factor-like helix-turn-helix DNA-binding protein [Nocardia blacklockiae]|uniref:sigma factor-like helix-turn-helix DNA-binding protein n=1 Tax=Nocardia blacklockiae TaxID=480036 RepID=UPI003F6996DA